MAVDAAKVAEKYERGGEDELTTEERRFLQDRGVTLQESVPVTFKLPGGQTISNDPVALLNNMTEQRQADIEAELERRVEAEVTRRLAEETLRNEQHRSIVEQTDHTGTANPTKHPTATPINPDPEDLEDEDEDEEDEGEGEGEDEDYGEGWNNDRRRGELSKRGLSTAGSKEELIARLIRSDDDETTDDDKA